ncbi:MAG: hypothetical protein D6722_08195 [Bacteroidetes bacterium]|nr:MAG: hypothetical protein D6722_08195 [Bacteroidota bacterium]
MHVPGSLQGQVSLYSHGLSGRIEAGPSFLDLSRLNASLSSQLYEPLTDDLFALGFGFHRIQRRTMVGGSLYNYLVSRSTRNNQIAITGYHYFTLRAGWLLSSSASRWKVYPTVGLGAGLLRFQAKPSSEPVPVSYWTGGPVTEVAFHASRLSGLSPEQGYFLELGVSAGYLSTFENTWILRNFGQDESGLPASPRGLFVRFTLGMGRWQAQP